MKEMKEVLQGGALQKNEEMTDVQVAYRAVI